MSIDGSPTTISTKEDDDGTFKYSVSGNGYILGISDVITNVQEKDIDGEVELDVIKMGIVNIQDKPMKNVHLVVYVLDKEHSQYGTYRMIRINEPKYPYISSSTYAYISPNAVEYFYIPFNHRLDDMEIVSFEIGYLSDYTPYTEFSQINLNES